MKTSRLLAIAALLCALAIPAGAVDQQAASAAPMPTLSTGYVPFESAPSVSSSSGERCKAKQLKLEQIDEGTPTIRVDVVDDGVLYAGGVHGTIHAFSGTSGDELWRYSSSQPAAFVSLVSDMLLAGTSNNILPNSTTLQCPTSLFVLDALSGRELWSIELSDVVTIVGISNDLLIVHSVMSHFDVKTTDDLLNTTGLVALDIRTGEIAWHSARVYDAFIPAEAPGVFYVTRPTVGVHEYDFAALDSGTGRELWFAEVDSVTGFHVVGGNGELVFIATGQVETMLSADRGTLWAIERATGRVMWMRATGGRGIASNRVVTVGSVVICAWSDDDGDDSVIVGLDVATGELEWAEPISGYVHHAPIGNGDIVLVGNASSDQSDRADVGIYALHAARGGVVWFSPTNSKWAEALSIGSGRIVVVARYSKTESELLVALDPSTGERRWKKTIAGYGDIVGFEADRIYVTSGRHTDVVCDLQVYVSDEHLMAVNSVTGETIWSLDIAGPTPQDAIYESPFNKFDCPALFGEAAPKLTYAAPIAATSSSPVVANRLKKQSLLMIAGIHDDLVGMYA